VELELTLVDSYAQLLQQLQTVAVTVELLLVDRQSTGPRQLRAIHREIGATEQVVWLGRVGGHHRDPDCVR